MDTAMMQQYLKHHFELKQPEHIEQVSTVLYERAGKLIEPNANIDGFLKELMRFRNELFISAKQHKLVSIPPGTAYDPVRMSSEDDNGNPLQVKKSHKVKLCIWPGIIAHSDRKFTNEWHPDHDFREALLESRKFFPEGSDLGKYKGWEDESIISKAVVLVEKV